ncbi:MAG: pentapeptide repeat-containing protein [Microcystaceae cyanobacterium]
MKRSTYVIRQYREGRRDFRGLDLKREDLEETDLSEADFSGSDIRGVSFKNTNLTNAKFEQIKAGQPSSHLPFLLVGSIGFIVLSNILLFRMTYHTCLFVASNSFLVQSFGYLLIFMLITVFSITYYNNSSGLSCFTGGTFAGSFFILIGMASALVWSSFARILILLVIFSFLYCFIRSMYALVMGNNKHFNISYSFSIGYCFAFYSFISSYSFTYGFHSTLPSWIHISFLFLPFISLLFTITFYILPRFNLVKRKTWLEKFAHNFSSFRSTSFVSTNLTNAQFTDTNLQTTRFHKADISQACFYNVKINIEQIQQAKNWKLSLIYSNKNGVSMG